MWQLPPRAPKASGHSHSEQTRTQTRTDTEPVVVPFPLKNELLALQIQAFLHATQDEELDGDVEIDEEIVKDILEVLSDPRLYADGGKDEQLEEEGDNYLSGSSDSTFDYKARRGSREIILEETPLLWKKHEIKPIIHLLKERGPAEFISEYVKAHSIPIPKLLGALGVSLCPELWNRKPKTMLYFLQVAMARVRTKRDKLAKYNTIEDAVKLISQSERILVLTGAGISVSCGIPDFRSRDGLYSSLKDKGEYELDDPQQMFDIDYFRENPAVFYSFASQIYPSNFEPSPCHRFIKLIEDKGKLLRNYTQNIDTLETRAGVKNILQCHGSFATATCLNCRRKVPGKDIEEEILSGKVPLCVVCNRTTTQPKKRVVKKSKKKKLGEWDSDCEDESDGPEYPPGVMKPDITFFGEKLSDEFDHRLAEDRFKVDLLLVIGTSLKVSPVAEILSHLPHSIPQILINRTPIRHINPDIILLGNADDIVTYLCERLRWKLPSRTPTLQTGKPTLAASGNDNLLQVPKTNVNLKKRPSEDDGLGQRKMVRNPRRVGESHIWLFEGAEGGKWLQQQRNELGIANGVGGNGDSPAVDKSEETSKLPSHGRQARVDDDGERETKKQRVM